MIIIVVNRIINYFFLIKKRGTTPFPTWHFISSHGKSETHLITVLLFSGKLPTGSKLMQSVVKRNTSSSYSPVKYSINFSLSLFVIVNTREKSIHSDLPLEI